MSTILRTMAVAVAADRRIMRVIQAKYAKLKIMPPVGFASILMQILI